MAGAEIALDVDAREFERALEECAGEIATADYMELTANAQRFLRAVVRYLETRKRTGNLISAAIPVWRRLGLLGRPPTALDEGQKLAEWIEKSTGRRRSAKLMSRGVYEDRRGDPVAPMFKYELFAAEWRGRNKRDRSAAAIDKALRAGLLGERDLRRIAAMAAGGVSYTVIWDRLVDLLSGTPGGRSWLINNESGYWKPYSTFFRGNRKQIKLTTPEFKWNGRHAKVLAKHSGK